MALKQRIQDDLKAALLGGDRFAAETLRGLKAAILNEEVARNLRDEGLSDPAIEQIIAKEIKKRLESAALYDQNNRQDSAADERHEADILGNYLPTQLTEAELKTIVDAKVTELNANGMQMMGQVIGAVKEYVGNTADGATIAKLVKQRLG
jgi:uncharacterized protein YqeY